MSCCAIANHSLAFVACVVLQACWYSAGRPLARPVCWRVFLCTIVAGNVGQRKPLCPSPPTGGARRLCRPVREPLSCNDFYPLLVQPAGVDRGRGMEILARLPAPCLALQRTLQWGRTGSGAEVPMFSTLTCTKLSFNGARAWREIRGVLQTCCALVLAVTSGLGGASTNR